MNCHSTIPVFELFGSSISTRESSPVLMELIKNDPCNHVELDFSSIDYISRSFADQFHLDKINYANEFGKTILVANASEEVIKMLQAVAKSHNSKDKKRTAKVPAYKYASYNELEGFLLSL